MAERTYRERLEELRDRLAREIEDSDALADARTLAALSKEYRATLAELEALPAPKEVSASAALRDRVVSAWGAEAGGSVA